MNRAIVKHVYAVRLNFGATQPVAVFPLCGCVMEVCFEKLLNFKVSLKEVVKNYFHS